MKKKLVGEKSRLSATRLAGLCWILATVTARSGVCLLYPFLQNDGMLAWEIGKDNRGTESRSDLDSSLESQCGRVPTMLSLTQTQIWDQIFAPPQDLARLNGASLKLMLHFLKAEPPQGSLCLKKNEKKN